MLGYDFGTAKLSVQQERLEAGFATPLAILHTFNGWADKFLNTPAAGLVDTNIKLSGAVAGFNLAAVLYRFESDNDKRIDLSGMKNPDQMLFIGCKKAAIYR